MIPKIIKKPIVFMPIESTPRELDYKINLARLFCNNEFDVIVGNPLFIRDELKYKNYRGAFLEKGANPDPQYYKSLKSKGMLLYCLSDEGTAYPAFSITYPPAVETLKAMDKIFLWGHSQMQDLMNRSSDAELIKKYRVTGYPGMDFSLSYYKTYHNALRPQNLPSSYILVNTNFGSHNGFDIEEVRKACNAMSPETAQILEKSYEREKICFGYFYDRIIKIIKSFPYYQFVIRPHPAEKKENYNKYFGGFQNVIVSKDGDINQLISTAKLVIHSDCSSALQAYLMKVPVISMAFPYKDIVRAPWALTFGEVPDSVEYAVELIYYAARNNSLPSDIASKISNNAQKTIKKMFNNIGNSSQDVSSIITSDINKNLKDFKPYRVLDSRSLLQKTKLFVRKLLPLHYKVPLASRLLLKKFNKEDVQTRISLLNKIDGLNFEYKIKKIFPNTFYISKISK